MTDQNGANNHNGRVTTRDLLTAVEGAEDRITHRIDRLETKVDDHITQSDRRIACIELDHASDRAKREQTRSIASGTKGFILAIVAIVSMVIGGAGVIVAIDANSDAFHQTIEVVEP